MKNDDSIDVQKKKQRRQDTRLESEAAEFLVLGHLLLLRIASYKTYTNLRGYDVMAINPDNTKLARIQVTSRWESGASGFPIKNFECDFIVFAKLNRGKKGTVGKESPPEFFILPCKVVEAARRKDVRSKVYLHDIDKYEQYREAWGLIGEFLGAKGKGKR